MTDTPHDDGDGDRADAVVDDAATSDAAARPALSTLPGGESAAVEAILAVVDEPVSAARIAGALGLPTDHVVGLLASLARSYREQERGYELREVAGAWRLYSASAFGEYVESFVLDGQTARLTQASLETLAVVAYRQPVSRGRIAGIRGVNVDGVVRTLLSRGLIEEAGRDGDGGATLYRTTTYFLERMGLGSLEELPPLAPYLPDVEELADIEGQLR